MTAPVDTAEVAEPVEVLDETDGEMRVRFPVVVIEGVDTSDGRYLSPGSLSPRALPLSVLAQPASPHGGDDPAAAVVIGRIDTLTRHPGPELTSRRTGQPFAEGTFIWSGEGAIDATHPVADLVRKRYLRGVSVDLAGMDFEVVGEEGFAPDPGNPRRQVITHSAEIAAVTLVPIPAFGDCYVELADEDTVPEPITAEELPEGLMASAAPTWRAPELDGVVVAHEETVTASADTATLPPIAWFRDPSLDQPTIPPIVTEDGRVFGHVAAWQSRHIGYSNGHVDPPRSRTDYAYFHTGAARVLGDDGQLTTIPAGHIALDTGHAGLSADHRSAAAHYDNTGSLVADVCAGEDEHGIWVAGAVVPGVDDIKLHKLRSCGLSGDWRRIGSGLELVAAISVPTPGFPVPRARVASGAPQALVAAGALRPGDVPRADGAVVLDYDTLATAIATRLDERGEQRRQAGELAAAHTSLVEELDDTPTVVAALLAEVDDTPERVAELLAELDGDDEVAFAISQMPPQLQASYLKGEVAARIVWGTPGDWRRCVAQAKTHGMGRKAEGACNMLHKKAVGYYPGDKRNK